MRITLGNLRKYIHEEVFRNYLWSAGFFGGGTSANSQGRQVDPPPDLGSPEDQEEELDYDEQEKSQAALRVDDRART
jgi:hypothetical protein